MNNIEELPSANATFDPRLAGKYMKGGAVMPNSVKNIHGNPQYQKGMKLLDKNNRMYSAETTHRYKSNSRRFSQSKAY
jgi:hypothetical protein